MTAWAGRWLRCVVAGTIVLLTATAHGQAVQDVDPEEPSAGTGSEASPWQVWSLGHLRWISETPSSWDNHFLLVASIDAEPTASWNSGAGFSPIGTNANTFRGNFLNDGQFEISNLTINRPGQNDVGLFGYAQNAEINGIRLVDATISGLEAVGGLIGYAFFKNVTDCSTAGTVTAQAKDVGGLIGFADSTYFLRCSSSATVTGTNQAGGLIGLLLSNPGIANSISSVIDCSASGQVTVTNDNAGGVAGALDGANTTVRRTFATGAITGNQDVGGLVGTSQNGAMIRQCYATGTVEGSQFNIGGLVGTNRSASIEDSFATGAVEGTGAGSEPGGLVGYVTNNGSVARCYAAGRVTGSFPGGIIAFSDGGPLNDCFFDTTTTQVSSSLGVNNDSNAAGVSGRNTGQMQTQSTFTNWNFNTVWGMTTAAGYPRHQWQLHTVNFAVAPGTRTGGGALTQVVLDGTAALAPTVTPPVGTQLDWVADFSVVTSNLNVAAAFTTPAAMPAGNGSSATPYQIASLANLRWLSETPTVWDDNAHFRIAADIDAAETASWNFGRGFAPIGDAGPDQTLEVAFRRPFENGDDRPFRGRVVNPDRFVIANLFIRRPNQDGIGLFGAVEESIIDSLVLTDATVSGRSFVGILVGDVTDTTFENAFTSGTVTGIADFNEQATNFGGLVGRAWSSTIRRSASSATVGRDGGGNVAQSGGLVGTASGETLIFDCHASGNVTATFFVGGLAGGVSHLSVVRDSYAASTVSGGEAAGLTGAATDDVTIEDCFFDFDATGQTEVIPVAVTFDVDDLSIRIEGAVWDGITGLSTSEMQTRSTFVNAGWDFTYWGIDDGNDYPRLFWELPTFAVQYNLGEGRLLDNPEAIVVDQVHLGGNAVYYLPGPPAGSRFEGWDDVADLTNVTEARTVTAIYSTVAVAPTGVDGTTVAIGTADNPYNIASLANLRWLSETPEVWGDNANFRITADIDASETEFWNNGRGFSPIGDGDQAFVGTVTNAGFHEIDGLVINRPETTGVGLFGIVQDADLSGVLLAECNIVGGNETGGVVGRISDSSMAQCGATGSITGGDVTGGLAGQLAGTTVRSGYASATVTGRDKVGGLAGQHARPGENHARITNSYATGSVSGRMIVGGFVGNAIDSSISNSYAAATVSG